MTVIRRSSRHPRCALSPCVREVRAGGFQRTDHLRDRSRLLVRPGLPRARTLGRGAGKTVPLHRADARRKRTRAYRFSGDNPAFPAQWFYGVYALSPVTGLSCHRRPRSAQLDTSVGVTGPHGFAVRELPARLGALRPPHPAPTSVTFAKRPSDGTGCDGYKLICDFAKQNIFAARAGHEAIAGELICPSDSQTSAGNSQTPITARLAVFRMRRPPPGGDGCARGRRRRDRTAR